MPYLYCVGTLNTLPLSTNNFIRKKHSAERTKSDLFNKTYFLLTNFDSCHLALSQLTLQEESVFWVLLTKVGFTTPVSY